MYFEKYQPAQSDQQLFLGASTALHTLTLKELSNLHKCTVFIARKQICQAIIDYIGLLEAKDFEVKLACDDFLADERQRQGVTELDKLMDIGGRIRTRKDSPEK